MREFIVWSSAHSHQERIEASYDARVKVHPFGNRFFCKARKFVFVCVRIVQQVGVNLFYDSDHNRLANIVNRNQQSVDSLYKGKQIRNDRSVLQGFQIYISKLGVAS